MGVTSLRRHTRPACNQALLAMCWLKKLILTSIECVFLDFCDARGLGLLFVVCACAVGLRGNRLTGMRGIWGVVWRSAHVPTIPFTWLRRANALDPTTHASNYQALLSTKLCQECGSNSCVRVFLIPWGHVAKTLICDVKKSHGRNARFWLVKTKFAALWLVTDHRSHHDYWHRKEKLILSYTRTLLGRFLANCSSIFLIFPGNDCTFSQYSEYFIMQQSNE